MTTNTSEQSEGSPVARTRMIAYGEPSLWSEARRAASNVSSTTVCARSIRIDAHVIKPDCRTPECLDARGTVHW